MSGLSYPVQQSFYALGAVDAPVTLTTSYADNVSDPKNVEHYSELTFCVTYTPGSGGDGNSIQIKVEGSPDPLDNDDQTVTDFYQETSASTSGGTITHYAAEHTYVGTTGGVAESFFFYVPPAYLTLRLSAKETVGGGEAGTVTIRAITSGN